MPEVDSEVIVAFEAGDFRRGYIVGAAWNGKAAQPETPKAANNIRVLRTREESRLEFDDTAGSPKISLTTKSGHKVILDEGRQEITIAHINGCTIKLNSSGGIDITANTSVKVTAPSLKVDAPTSTFTGIVKCLALETDVSVKSPVYSSGVGNLW